MRVAIGLLLFGVLGGVSTAHAASDQEVRAQFFQEFCVAPGSVQATVNALQASPKVAPATVRDISGRKYISFAIRNQERGVVTVINPSIGGLWCSVGIKNVGINLYTDGRVVQE